MVLVYREVLCVYTHREENAERIRRGSLFMGFLTHATWVGKVRDREKGC
jgi:hypothetical protein